jgi:tetratricopeptide (TPR) repeat protein
LDHARGTFAAGEPPARRAWEIRRELLGDEHPDTLADACAHGGLLDGLGRHAESKAIYLRALAVYERLYGPEHFEVAATLHNLAAAEALEDGAAAERCYRRALAIKGKLLGEDHPEWGLTANNLAVLLNERGQREEAARLLQQAAAVMDARLETGHPLRELTRANLARSG